MTRISASDPVLDRIPIDKFVSYLEKNGWTRTDHPNDRIFLFQGPPDDYGKPLRLILPRHHDLEDANSRLAEALNLLAIVQKISPDYVINRIGGGPDASVADETARTKETGEGSEEKGGGSAIKEFKNLPLRLRAVAIIIVAILLGTIAFYIYRGGRRENNLVHALSRIKTLDDISNDIEAYEDSARSVLRVIEVMDSSEERFRLVYSLELPDEGSKVELKPASNPMPKSDWFYIRADANPINDLEQSKKRLDELLSLLDKNKDWLGKDAYKIIRDYSDTVYDYYIALNSRRDTKEMDAKRDNVKNLINRLKDEELKRNNIEIN